MAKPLTLDVIAPFVKRASVRANIIAIQPRTPIDLARINGVSVETVGRMVAAGLIPCENTDHWPTPERKRVLVAGRKAERERKRREKQTARAAAMSLTVHQRIIRAYRARTGLRLTAGDIDFLAHDQAIWTCAENDDEAQGIESPPRSSK